MLPPRRNRLVYRFFSWYIGRIIKTDFHEFNFNAVEFDRNKSVLLLANHFSWWDGFLLFYINKKHLKKRFHVMISEENYRSVWFLKYLGGFSVGRNPKSIVETLEHAGRLLNNPDNLVLLFPQGKIHSGHSENIDFQKGLMGIINASSRKFEYLFAAIFMDHFQHRKPSVFCFLERWEPSEYISLQLIKSEYNKHYDRALSQQRAVTV